MCERSGWWDQEKFSYLWGSRELRPIVFANRLCSGLIQLYKKIKLKSGFCLTTTHQSPLYTQLIPFHFPQSHQRPLTSNILSKLCWEPTARLSCQINGGPYSGPYVEEGAPVNVSLATFENISKHIPYNWALQLHSTAEYHPVYTNNALTFPLTDPCMMHEGLQIHLMDKICVFSGGVFSCMCG